LEILQVLLQFKTVLTEVCLENKRKAWLLRYLLDEPMLLAFHSHTTYQWTSFYWIGSSGLDVGSEAVWSNWLFNYWHLSCSSTWSCMHFYFIRSTWTSLRMAEMMARLASRKPLASKRSIKMGWNHGTLQLQL
jgi:hypothetical protein